MGSSNDITYVDGFVPRLTDGVCAQCPHNATMEFEWAPGHSGGLMCDCCIRLVWEETLENVTSALARQVISCPRED